MNEPSPAVANGSIGFTTVLFFILFTLKLTGVISWSWWWVFLPLFAPLALAAIIIIILVIYGATVSDG